jgi:CBS domain-containing protein
VALQVQSALDLAVRSPTIMSASATVGDVRRFLAGEHVHLALVVAEDGTLLTSVNHDDLCDRADLPDHAPAVLMGTLEGRTVPADLPRPRLTTLLLESGSRRMAVVSTDGRLLGLVCLKRSGHGFCTDEGVHERRRARKGERSGTADLAWLPTS